MKKEIRTCDMCGHVVDGPSIDRPDFVRSGGSVVRAKELSKFRVIDLCRDDAPGSVFDERGMLNVVFGGGKTFDEGEVVDVSGMEPIMVVFEDAASQQTSAYSLEQVSQEQREYVSELADAIEQRHRLALEQDPRDYDFL